MTKPFLILISTYFSFTCLGQHQNKTNEETQEMIIEQYLKNGAWNHHYLCKDWEVWIDKGLQKDSTIAYLWQQKAIPYWKQKKYSTAIKYYNKAILYDRQRWLSRLAFLKCIFAKDYHGALTDLKTYKNEFGQIHVQDHSLDFYMGLCYLQLNKFKQALKVLEHSIERDEKEHGADWVHYLDRYYLAVAHYELGNYPVAITELDKVLKEYPNFSDAQYHKSLCLNALGKKEEAKELMLLGKANLKKGYTFNEDSNKYETYPYQITWQWDHIQSILK